MEKSTLAPGAVTRVDERDFEKVLAKWAAPPRTR
jgi:hypothetical protein